MLLASILNFSPYPAFYFGYKQGTNDPSDNDICFLHRSVQNIYLVCLITSHGRFIDLLNLIDDGLEMLQQVC